MTRRSPFTSLVAVLGVATLGLTACGGAAKSADQPQATSTAPTVLASFYPLEWASSRIVGDVGVVGSMTASGVDPHDLELTPQTVAAVSSADLVVYSAGLQPAVDEAVSTQAGGRALDVNDAANLIETGAADNHEHGGQEAGHEEAGAHEDEDLDPHFWLDPDRMADVSILIADRLAAQDPEHAATYQRNTDALVEDLRLLSSDMDAALASCSQEDMVVTHEAFGYLASEHGFHQVGISGLTPQAEPTPARLAEVVQLVRETGVSTIYAGLLRGTDAAQTVANETDTQVLILDPLEGLTDDSPGWDYRRIMRANLDALVEGQDCA